jgi:tetratricopeptide (TPR) repeat protein
MLHQAISLSLLAAAVASIPPAASQGITGSISGNTRTGPPATRVLVATPYPSSPGDSVAAVTIGDVMRRKLSGNLGSDWLVITRQEMNKNLMTWGYGADQLFAPESARSMAVAMTARVFVMTTLTKGGDGRMTASIRVTGVADEAGQVVKATQLPGQKIEDFAGKITDQINVIFKAYPEAKQCGDNLTVNKVKAAESANKAIKIVPNYGLPEYCLGLIEQAKDSVGPETMRHFKNAIIGDPFSIKAINQVAIIDQKKHDTTAVVADYQQLLTVAPTNRALADEAVKIFNQYNRPDAAEQVVDAQMKLDPSSPDWPELKGNLCAARGVSQADTAKARAEFACAYASFNQEYTLDPSRADTNFYPRMVFVAGTRADSMLWARRWAKAFASSTDPYKVEMQIYMDAGQIDSVLNVVKVLAAVDPNDAKPVVAVEVMLLNKQRYDDAIALQSYLKNAPDDAKNQFAGLLVSFADSAGRRTPQDDSAMVKLGQAVVAFNPPNKTYFEFGHYFIVRGLQNGLTVLSKAARDDKSCDTIKRYTAFLDVLEPSLTVISASTNAGIASYGNQLLTPVQAERKAIPELQKAFCKP